MKPNKFQNEYVSKAKTGAICNGKKCHMKLRFILIPLLILVFIDGARALPVFTNLGAHKSIKIEVQSSGCFHNSYTVYEFSNTALIITEIIDEEKRTLGRIKLSPLDIANLDKLMEFYSRKLKQGCTTVDTIAIQEISDGRVVSAETVIDSSCSLDHAKYLTFYELKERLKNSLKNEM